jgi:hypothetical protein
VSRSSPRTEARTTSEVGANAMALPPGYRFYSYQEFMRRTARELYEVEFAAVDLVDFSASFHA